MSAQRSIAILGGTGDLGSGLAGRWLAAGHAAEGSAAEIAQALLGDGVKVVSAFHNVGASKLHAGERADCDVLVFGNDKEARDIVVALADDVASRGIDGGVLANSAAAEALTSVLIGINRRYKVPGAGIRITGLS